MTAKKLKVVMTKPMLRKLLSEKRRLMENDSIAVPHACL